MARRILLVDGDPVDRALRAIQLGDSPLFHYNLSEANDIGAAIETLRNTPFDCVLVSCGLTNQEGVDYVRHLQDISADPFLPVIVLTEQSRKTQPIESTSCDAADYLAKEKTNTASLDRSIDNAIVKSELKRSVAQERQRLSELRTELLRGNSEIQSFYQSVSHELKTPLTAIREYISLIADRVVGDINSEQEEFLATALVCCDRLTRLVNDLFDTARIETGKLELIPEKLDIATLVQDIAAQHQRKCQENQLSLSCRLCDNLPALQGDSVRIAQVLSNLLGNAIKFTQPGGNIQITTMRVPGSQQIDIVVADNGKGIADSDILRIFDRLYQCKPDNVMHHEGLGIGLYLSSTIAKLHGGDLSVQSREGEGSRFTLTLPLRMPLNSVGSMANLA